LTGPAFIKRSSESTEAQEHSKDNNGLALPSSYQARRTPHGDLISNTFKKLLFLISLVGLINGDVSYQDESPYLAIRQDVPTVGSTRMYCPSLRRKKST
jgi:hypothetical protein